MKRTPRLRALAGSALKRKVAAASRWTSRTEKSAGNKGLGHRAEGPDASEVGLRGWCRRQQQTKRSLPVVTREQVSIASAERQATSRERYTDGESARDSAVLDVIAGLIMCEVLPPAILIDRNWCLGGKKLAVEGSDLALGPRYASQFQPVKVGFEHPHAFVQSRITVLRSGSTRSAAVKSKRTRTELSAR